MKKSTLNKNILISLLFVFIWLMFNQPVFAGKWGDTPTGQDCNIAEVYVDFENELMATDGRNFDNSDYLMSNSVMIQNH